MPRTAARCSPAPRPQSSLRAAVAAKKRACNSQTIKQTSKQTNSHTETLVMHKQRMISDVLTHLCTHTQLHALTQDGSAVCCQGQRQGAARPLGRSQASGRRLLLREGNRERGGKGEGEKGRQKRESGNGWERDTGRWRGVVWRTRFVWGETRSRGYLRKWGCG